MHRAGRAGPAHRRRVPDDARPLAVRGGRLRLQPAQQGDRPGRAREPDGDALRRLHVKPSYGAFADVLDELDHTEPPPPEPQPDPGATTPLTQAPATPLPPPSAPAPSEAESTTPAPDASAPALRGLAVRPQRLRKRALRKALLVWRLSEPARLDLVLQRRARPAAQRRAGADRGREVRKRPRAAHADRTLARERPLRDPRRGDGRGRQSARRGRPASACGR